MQDIMNLFTELYMRFIYKNYKHYFVAGPPITYTSHIKGTALLQRLNLSSDMISKGPYIMKSPHFSSYSQQVWVIAVVQTDNTDGKIKII